MSARRYDSPSSCDEKSWVSQITKEGNLEPLLGLPHGVYDASVDVWVGEERLVFAFHLSLSF